MVLLAFLLKLDSPIVDYIYVSHENIIYANCCTCISFIYQERQSDATTSEPVTDKPEKHAKRSVVEGQAGKTVVKAQGFARKGN